MQAFREAATGLIYAAVSVVLVLGSLSLVLAEGTPSGSPPAASTVTAAATRTAVTSASPVPSAPFPKASTTGSPSPSALPSKVSPSATEPLLFLNIYAPRAAGTAIIPCGPYVGWVKAYRVQEGDTLFQIATRFGIPVEALRRANCRYRVTVYVGELLWVPNLPIMPGGGAIDQASSIVTVTCTAGAPYTYTGSPQTPCTAEATGVGMGPVDVTSSLVYSDNVNAGVATAYAGWGGDTNHTGSTGSGGFTIDRASSIVTVTCTAGAPYTYTGSPQTPCTAEAIGVGMSPVDVTSSLVYSDNVNAGMATANASWAGDTNHTGSTGSGAFTIDQASSTVTVTCTAGAPYTYTGSPQTPCAAEATGVGMSPVDVTSSLVYSNNINAGAATANANWAGDTNHTGSTGSGGFTIG